MRTSLAVPTIVTLPVDKLSLLPVTESTDNDIDFLSNGFKIRRNSGSVNTNGANNIYMAFGQSLVGSNNIPATAR